MNPSIDEFCKQKECEMYFEHELHDGDFGGVAILSSCYIEGMSFDIRVVPKQCLYSDEAEQYQIWLTLKGVK